MKGKAALPAGSKTRAIWTPARPPPAWHVPRAATRRATWEADGTERTSLWVPSIAVGVVGGTGSCHGAHLDRLLRQEQRLLPLCQLQADGSGVTPCSRGTVLAALVPPGQETKHRDGDQPLVQRDGGPRSNPLCSSWAHPAPLHPRARGCPSAETPRNGTAAPAALTPVGVSCVQPPPVLLAFEQPVKHSSYNRTVWKRPPNISESPSTSGVAKSYGGRCPNALSVHHGGPGAPITSLGSQSNHWTTMNTFS